MSSRLRTRLVKEEYNTGAHNVFHISRLKKATDTAAKAKMLELPRWMRKGFPSKITVERNGRRFGSLRVGRCCILKNKTYLVKVNSVVGVDLLEFFEFLC